MRIIVRKLKDVKVLGEMNQRIILFDRNIIDVCFAKLNGAHEFRRNALPSPRDVRGMFLS